MKKSLHPEFLQVALVALLVAALCSFNVAQESNSDDAPKEVESAAGGAAETYLAKFTEWKALIKEMRSLQAKYSTAETNEVPEIERRWNELVARGPELIDEMKDAGIVAYGEAPGEDRELERFLVKILADYMSSDRYEEAAELSQELLDKGCEIKQVFDAAGIAAFVTNDFPAAKKYLEQAEQEGVLSEIGHNYLALVPDYTRYWEEEQESRANDAKADDLPRVKVTTNKGEIVVELFENEAPQAVSNFVNLVEKGFYDDLTFHRVLEKFMAQGGCPLGVGTGGPGYNIYCECYEDGYRKHFRGTFSMAHSGRDTGGSQFFITFVPTSHLNGRHTAFGRVIEGMEVLAKIQRINPEEANKPMPDKIVKMEVLRKREHDYQPTKVN